ncbi:MAG: hypothetical protein PHW00_02015 [Clostridia bacterium]|nr:hypothetical protein [Clostridia bacterium]
MKRIISILLVLTLSTTLCVGLVGCDGVIDNTPNDAMISVYYATIDELGNAFISTARDDYYATFQLFTYKDDGVSQCRGYAIEGLVDQEYLAKHRDTWDYRTGYFDDGSVAYREAICLYQIITKPTTPTNMEYCHCNDYKASYYDQVVCEHSTRAMCFVYFNHTTSYSPIDLLQFDVDDLTMENVTIQRANDDDGNFVVYLCGKRIMNTYNGDVVFNRVLYHFVARLEDVEWFVEQQLKNFGTFVINITNPDVE